MWKVVANIYRASAFVFRERRNGFIKCPACKGTGFMSCGKHSISDNRHSIGGQFCWFCEGHGILPVTGLTGFVLLRTSSESQTQDMSAARNQVVPSMPSFATPWSSGMSYCRSVRFNSCLKTEEYLLNISKSPPWFADIQQGDVKTCDHLPENDAVPQDFNSIFSKYQNNLLVRHKAFCSATLLMSLLASVILSSSIDSQSLTFTKSLDAKGENESSVSDQPDTIFQNGSKQCCWEKWNCRTHIQRRRNRLRVKVVREAEGRARRILKSLIPGESKSSHK